MLYNDLIVEDCSVTRNPCQINRERSWVTSEQFYGGLGIVQAMPGPLFNFAAYLGAVIAMNAGQPFILGTVVAWVGLFSPGVVLMFAVRRSAGVKWDKGYLACNRWWHTTSTCLA
jgi:chromate transporter